jgi:hypothetical protein
VAARLAAACSGTLGTREMFAQGASTINLNPLFKLSRFLAGDLAIAVQMVRAGVPHGRQLAQALGGGSLVGDLEQTKYSTCSTVHVHARIRYDQTKP